MRISLIAAFALLMPIAAATAEVGPANSTNQHQRDSASFYDSIPESGPRVGKQADVDREAAKSRAQ